MKYYIGCSGFSYKEWKGEFYPEKLAAKEMDIYFNNTANGSAIDQCGTAEEDDR